MKIAICSETDSADGLVAMNFEKAQYLLLVDTDQGNIYDVIKKNDEGNILFAGKIVDEDCEAVITGPIEKVPFEIMANAGVSRFDGNGMKGQRAYIRFLRNQLPLIRDYIGGPGPAGHSHDFSCHDHDEGITADEALAEAIRKVRPASGDEEHDPDREDTLFVLGDEDAEFLPDEFEVPDGLSRDEIEKIIKQKIDEAMFGPADQ